VKSLSLDPNYVPSINNLAYLYSEKKDRIDEAQRLAERAKKIAPKDGVITDTLGWIYCKKGDYDKAITILKEARSLSPGEPIIRYHLGLAYMKSGMRGEAKKEIEGALGMAKHFPYAEEAKKILKGLSR
jgi:Tfp pilus assembly protein PilF